MTVQFVDNDAMEVSRAAVFALLQFAMHAPEISNLVWEFDSMYYLYHISSQRYSLL